MAGCAPAPCKMLKEIVAIDPRLEGLNLHHSVRAYLAMHGPAWGIT